MAKYHQSHLRRVLRRDLDTPHRGLRTITAIEPKATHWLDLGSGAGFPALVIAIQLSERPGSWVQCVESDRRKCAFLREVARATAIPVTVHASRIEDLDIGTISPVQVVTARAFRPCPACSNSRKCGYSAARSDYFSRSNRGHTIRPSSAYPRISIRSAPSKTETEGSVIRVRRGRRFLNDSKRRISLPLIHPLTHDPNVNAPCTGYRQPERGRRQNDNRHKSGTALAASWRKGPGN